MNDYALIFGQEQDRIRGGFERGQAYIGHLSEFNIWNVTLSEKDIFDMATCQTNINIFQNKQNEKEILHSQV